MVIKRKSFFSLHYNIFVGLRQCFLFVGFFSFSFPVWRKWQENNILYSRYSSTVHGVYLQQTVTVKERYTFLLLTISYCIIGRYFFPVNLLFSLQQPTIENELATWLLTIQHPLGGGVWRPSPSTPSLIEGKHLP